MSNKVIAITVTYNRANTLENTVKSLVNQTYDKLEKIIIVDNCSNEEHKNKISTILKSDERIELLQLDQNYGGAGGFHYGMKYVKEKYNPDWYWIMDDDAYPTENCLEQLLSYKDLSNIGYLAPVAYGVGNKKYQNYHHKLMSDIMQESAVFEDINKLNEVTVIDANAFVGPLFSRNAVDKIGLPDKDLFIYGDDSEYTYRCSKAGLNGYLIKSAIINHEDVVNNQNVTSPLAWWKDYYWIRNQYAFIDKYAVGVNNNFKGKLVLYKFIAKDTLRSLRIKEYKNLRGYRLELLRKAIRDAKSNNMSKSIDPATFIADIKTKI